jgi:RNase P subunit RPR2
VASKKPIKIKEEKQQRYICAKCWEVLKYEQNVKHKELNPDHISFLVTSINYATEQKFINISKKYNKVIKDESENEWIENPYKKKMEYK